GQTRSRCRVFERSRLPALQSQFYPWTNSAVRYREILGSAKDLLPPPTPPVCSVQTIMQVQIFTFLPAIFHTAGELGVHIPGIFPEPYFARLSTGYLIDASAKYNFAPSVCQADGAIRAAEFRAIPEARRR